MSMFLKKNEIKELTGYARPSSQTNWLIENSYPFEIGADGYPRVMYSYVERRLGGFTKQERKKRHTPNFAALAG